MFRLGLLQFHTRARKRSALLSLVIALLACSLAAVPSPIPRQSPEFTITMPSSRPIFLSAFRGKVVVIEFLFLQSNHCTRVAKILNKLYGEMGSRGFQPLGVVFDPPNSPESHGELIAPAVTFLKLTYPVGYSHKAAVDNFLDRRPNEILNIPQIVVIDRRGVMCAVSGGTGGDPRLEDEASLRALIEKLL